MKLFGSKNSSIRNQMLIMFLIVILPLFAASIMLLVNMRSEVTDKIISTANAKAESIRTRIADTVDSVESAMDMFATDENVIAFLENNLNEDGTVNIPAALQPYMGGKTKIE